MNILLIIISILTIAVFALRQTFVCKKVMAAWCIACALTAVWFGGIAVTLSKADMAAMVADKSLMRDLAVIVTIEVAAHIAFCVTDVMVTSIQDIGRVIRFAHMLLKYFPCIFIFPVICYILTRVIFLFPGVDFDVISYVFGAIVAIFLSLFSIGIKFLLPERSLRLEMLFVAGCLLAMVSFYM